jgi:hypothetical protein
MGLLQLCLKFAAAAGQWWGWENGPKSLVNKFSRLRVGRHEFTIPSAGASVLRAKIMISKGGLFYARTFYGRGSL